MLDLAVYHRALPYQAGWLALPFGLVELGVVMAVVFGLGITRRSPLRLGSSPAPGSLDKSSAMQPSRFCALRTPRTAASSDTPGR